VIESVGNTYMSNGIMLHVGVEEGDIFHPVTLMDGIDL
jgi:hypothetical protein